MIRHVFKLMWNRKRANVLLGIEVFVSFLLLFTVTTLGVHYVECYHLPLGYAVDDVMSVTLDTGQDRGFDRDGPPPAEQVATVRRLVRTLQDLPEVASIAGADTVPYQGDRWTSQANSVHFVTNRATDDLHEVLRIELTAGRWFGREDDGARETPVVVNELMARRFFGAEDPIGKLHREPNGDEFRVVGVVRDFRQDGELSPSREYVFFRHDLDRHGPFQNLVVRLRPGTPRDFQERLLDVMKAEARDWSFYAHWLPELRRDVLRLTLLPVIEGGIIVMFLMMMVALGVTGVVWQAVTQRTREIGVRRANGATAGAVQRQIIGELCAVATAAVALGVAVVAQFPFLDYVTSVPRAVYVEGVALSAAAIYVLAIACAWYPSRLAARVQPALALRHE